ncbi:MAG: hypothetical protein ACYC6A_14605 [Armatimonadota bacterium]
MSDNDPLIKTPGAQASTGRPSCLPRLKWGWFDTIGAVLLGFLLLSLFMPNLPMRAGRKTEESTLRANLHQLRQAIDAFKADTGVYPAALTDLSAADGQTLKARIKPDTYKGPYLSVMGGIADTGLPRNPFKQRSGADYPNPNAHWRYSAETGQVHSIGIITKGKEGISLDGIPYSQL